MTDHSQDEELKAIGTVLAALRDLQPDARDRVLAYVFTRLGISQGEASVKPQHSTAAESQDIKSEAEKHKKGKGHAIDIRTFADEKAPSSANEMAAVVAYYLQYEAPDTEKKEAITKSDIEKYFHLAKFRKPKDSYMALSNSKNAGYLDSRERGHFSLNAVGYNLVAHKLPRKEKNR